MRLQLFCSFFAALLLTCSSMDSNVITNIALKKPTKQSSTYGGYAVSSRAVDGDTNGNFFGKSVSCTNLNSRAFWEVTFPRQCSVHKIVIFNRADCCGSRLLNFDVILKNSLSQTVKTFYYGYGQRPKYEFVPSSPINNIRQVRVQLRGKNYLQLAEVQVFGHCQQEQTDQHNVALRKYAFQSSTFHHAALPVATKAIDGNIDGHFPAASTTHTNLNAAAWWEVDLGSTAEVTTIIVFNRADCCGERLSNFKVILYDFAHQTVQSFHEQSGGKPEYGFLATPPVNARYVRVQLLGTNYLQLAEVEVIGKPLGGYENVALGKVATQSSIYSHPFNPAAGLAVDGIIDGHFGVRSTTHTNHDLKAWWVVDLAEDTIVYGVTVFNRLDCCGERLQNFDVLLINAGGQVVKTVGFGLGVKVAYPVRLSGGVTARKVKVQLRGKNFLQLAEVQVLSGARTCGGTAEGARCVFPFSFKGVTYNACTTASTAYDKDRPWCATKLGDVGVHSKWGFCVC
eukprot:m.13377 g.13377  ORF g.13377 m.13377 type:complete len:511 (+) comp24755_c0_seq1:79-1611(+)